MSHSKFGWSLPPGCSYENIDEAFGGIEPKEGSPLATFFKNVAMQYMEDIKENPRIMLSPFEAIAFIAEDWARMRASIFNECRDDDTAMWEDDVFEAILLMVVRLFRMAEETMSDDTMQRRLMDMEVELAGNTGERTVYTANIVRAKRSYIKAVDRLQGIVVAIQGVCQVCNTYPGVCAIGDGIHNITTCLRTECQSTARKYIEDNYEA